MNCRFKDNMFTNKTASAFTLIEVIMAVTIIGVVTTTIMVVMNRCIEAVIDNRTRMQAFELARENMENLLALETVTDTAEFGVSEINPDIQWETVVEPFTEPVNSEMWLQAVCSASYTDSKGIEQEIELTHWLTKVPANIQKMILAQREKELELMDKYGEPGSYSNEQIEDFALEMDISVRESRLLLDNMSMYQAAKVVALAEKTGLTLAEAIKAMNMSPDEVPEYIFGITGISPGKIPEIIDEIDNEVPPEAFPPPDNVMGPEPDDFPEPETPEPDIVDPPVEPQDTSGFCAKYGLPPDCESWPLEKLLKALLELRQ